MSVTQRNLLIISLIFVLGVAIALVFAPITPHGHDACRDYQLINRMLACKDRQVLPKGALGSLQDQVETLIAKQVAMGTVAEASVYFRDLQAGPVFDIEGDSSFSPASLLKLPLAFAYLSFAEEHPTELTAKLLYQVPSGANVVDGQEIEPLGELELWQEYTVKELLRNMLVYSDNLAYHLLVGHLSQHVEGGQSWMLQTLRELGIVEPQGGGDEIVTVHEYSSLFRQLYNSSYLTPEYSEWVLQWLSESTFNQGLVAGVPENITVAHKYGIRDIDIAKQLHDCGIVYYPKNPYLLCVITRGEDLEQLGTVIKDISALVYAEFDKRHEQYASTHTKITPEANASPIQ